MGKKEDSTPGRVLLFSLRKRFLRKRAFPKAECGGGYVAGVCAEPCGAEEFVRPENGAEQPGRVRLRPGRMPCFPSRGERGRNRLNFARKADKIKYRNKRRTGGGRHAEAEGLARGA